MIGKRRSYNEKNNHDSRKEILIKTRLETNIQYVKKVLGNSGDIIIREINLGKQGEIRAAIIYTDGLTDTKSIQHFMETLMFDFNDEQLESNKLSKSSLLDYLKSFVLTVGEIQDVNDFDSLFTYLLSGNVIFLLDGYTKGIVIGLKGWRDRGVTESSSESVIRGPKEAFSENLRTNTALIRRKIKDPDLWLENKVIGRVTKTNVALMYIKGIAKDDLVQEVRERLEKIDIDSILESGYIEELIQDNTLTPFPTIYNSERPDVVASLLLEGRVAIVVDGTPFVLVAPALFVQFFQAAEDYYERADISSFLRFLRFCCFLIALLVPSLYIALTTFHHEMILPNLLFSLLAQREGVPFPAFVEVLLMEIAFEILREAGIRMPRAVGSAITIVGTLVIGQAAVQAGIVSAFLIIVVSITAISSFVLPAPNMSISVRLLRFPMIGLASFYGLFGIFVGVIALVLHLSSLRSFGVPYMSSFAPISLDEQRDTLIRLPHWALSTRPKPLTNNRVREQTPAPRPPK
ncbi:spore germination protein [Bacillus sp. FJAT-50079]|uniref:spore germination protein n=1 Tax=Bacillus sp. FJAT-50079 TaxID=2833577 RepID=UPI001BCA13FE|nr:spore germination protein [Bacillus sp. FJAT-50079]MBS4210005.1 spore germination protein [Bacillus sp. FJAT-50079]